MAGVAALAGALSRLAVCGAAQVRLLRVFRAAAAGSSCLLEGDVAQAVGGFAVRRGLSEPARCSSPGGAPSSARGPLWPSGERRSRWECDQECSLAVCQLLDGVIVCPQGRSVECGFVILLGHRCQSGGRRL